jgi:hypothetical protein
VYRSGVVAFLKWLTLTAKLPFIVDRKIQVSSLLMTSTYWKEILFDKSSTSITRTNVDSLFLSLAASGILEIQNSPDGIRWMLGYQAPTTATTDTNVALIHATIGTAMYTLDEYWVGINLHPVTRIRVDTLIFNCNNLISALACNLLTPTLLHFPVHQGCLPTSIHFSLTWPYPWCILSSFSYVALVHLLPS